MRRRSFLIGSLVAGTAFAAKAQTFKSVRDFGAKGDGVTDDTVSMQRAHSTGEVIFYPPGRYKFSKIRLFSGGIIGAGVTALPTKPLPATALLPTSTDGAAIEFSGSALTSNAPVFQDFAMLAEGTGDSLTGIKTGSNDQKENYFHRFEGLLFRGIGNCLQVQAASSISIRDCNFQYYAGFAVNLSDDLNVDAGDSSITGCHFFNGTGQPYGARGTSITQRNSGGLRIINNKFNGGSAGYLLNLAAPTSVLIMNGNSFENIKGAAVQFRNIANSQSKVIRFAHVTINANEFSGNTQDIFFEEISNYSNLSYWDNIAIVGNILYPTQKEDVKPSIWLQSCRHATIIGNIINGNGANGTGIMIDPSCSDIIVDLNNITGLTTPTKIAKQSLSPRQ